MYSRLKSLKSRCTVCGNYIRLTFTRVDQLNRITPSIEIAGIGCVVRRRALLYVTIRTVMICGLIGNTTAVQYRPSGKNAGFMKANVAQKKRKTPRNYMQ